MTNLVSKLALTAALAAAVPSFASARPCDDDRRAVPVAPGQYGNADPYARLPEGSWRESGGRHGGWRHYGWRQQERERLHAEFARLDEQRAEFHARWGWHARKVARFERRYGYERAELERRWAELDGYALR